MKKTTFQGLLLILADETKQDLSDGMVQQWWKRYRHLDERTFEAACERYLEGHKFWPAPMEFREALDAVMSPEEREIQAGIVFWKGWIAQGIVPRVGSVAEYAAIREALGLPAPSETERYRCERSILERDPDAIDGRHGPVFARLLGSERPALVAGSR